MLQAIQHGKASICFKEAIFSVFTAQKIFHSKYLSADGSVATVFQTKQLQNLAQLNNIIVLYIRICVYIYIHICPYTHACTHTHSYKHIYM